MCEPESTVYISNHSHIFLVTSNLNIGHLSCSLMMTCNVIILWKEMNEFKIFQLEGAHLMSSTERAAIYVSLAQTYADLKEFDQALYYYQREMEETGDNQEQVVFFCLTIKHILCPSEYFFFFRFLCSFPIVNN